MKLSIVLATRGRPDLLIPTIQQTVANMTRPDTTLLVACDADDAETLAVRRDLGPRVAWSVREREDFMGEKYNRVLEIEPGDIYLPMVDYRPHITRGFDQRIVDAASLFPDRIGVVYNHMANLSFPEMIAVTAPLVRRMGFFVPPYYPFWFWDHELDDIAKMIGRIAFADVRLGMPCKPPTHGLRDVNFWTTYFDLRARRRRAIAHRIIDDDGFCEPLWRRRLLLSHHPLFEGWSKMLNQNVRDRFAGKPTLAPDERSERIKAAVGIEMLALYEEMEAEELACAS